MPYFPAQAAPTLAGVGREMRELVELIIYSLRKNEKKHVLHAASPEFDRLARRSGQDVLDLQRAPKSDKRRLSRQPGRYELIDPSVLSFQSALHADGGFPGAPGPGAERLEESTEIGTVEVGGRCEFRSHF